MRSRQRTNTMIYLFVAGLMTYSSPSSFAAPDVVVSSDVTVSWVEQSDGRSRDNSAFDTWEMGGATTLAEFPDFVSQVDYGYSQGPDGFPTIIDLSFQQTRWGSVGSFSRGSNVAFFRDDSTRPAEYQITGAYTNSSGLTKMIVFLYDYTVGAYAFENTQYFDGGTTLFVGESVGYNNSLSGSQTGRLIQGHEYGFSAQVWTEAGPTADAGAAATGSIHLIMDTKLPGVPEPSSLLMLSTISIGAILVRRRKTGSYIQN